MMEFRIFTNDPGFPPIDYIDEPGDLIAGLFLSFVESDAHRDVEAPTETSDATIPLSVPSGCVSPIFHVTTRVMNAANLQ